MTAASKEKHPVTLPEGVSLRRVARGVAGCVGGQSAPVDECATHAICTKDAPQPQGHGDARAAGCNGLVPAAAPNDRWIICSSAAWRCLPTSKAATPRTWICSCPSPRCEKIPELKIEDRSDFFARGKFRSIQVDLLLTKNPLFKIVAEKFATRHSFDELTVPTATVEGMILLKLFALPSL